MGKTDPVASELEDSRYEVLSNPNTIEDDVVTDDNMSSWTGVSDDGEDMGSVTSLTPTESAGEDELDEHLDEHLDEPLLASQGLPILPLVPRHSPFASQQPDPYFASTEESDLSDDESTHGQADSTRTFTRSFVGEVGYNPEHAQQPDELFRYIQTRERRESRLRRLRAYHDGVADGKRLAQRNETPLLSLLEDKYGESAKKLKGKWETVSPLTRRRVVFIGLFFLSSVVSAMLFAAFSPQSKARVPTPAMTPDPPAAARELPNLLELVGYSRPVESSSISSQATSLPTTNPLANTLSSLQLPRRFPTPAKSAVPKPQPPSGKRGRFQPPEVIPEKFLPKQKPKTRINADIKHDAESMFGGHLGNSVQSFYNQIERTGREIWGSALMRVDNVTTALVRFSSLQQHDENLARIKHGLSSMHKQQSKRGARMAAHIRDRSHSLSTALIAREVAVARKLSNSATIVYKETSAFARRTAMGMKEPVARAQYALSKVADEIGKGMIKYSIQVANMRQSKTMVKAQRSAKSIHRKLFHRACGLEKKKVSGSKGSPASSWNCPPEIKKPSPIMSNGGLLWGWL